MITVARPTDLSRPHYYAADGTPAFTVPNKTKGGLRAVTVKDCRALQLRPSPTTVTRLLHRHALVQWQVEQAVLSVISSPQKPGEPLDDFIERIIHVERVQDEERNLAADRGKWIHNGIAEVLSGVTPTEWSDELAAYVTPAVAAVLQLGRVVATEKRIVAPDYCGTTDLILENDTEIWLIDHKTCRRIPDAPYDENKLQLAAYSGGLGNTGDKVIRCANVYISTTTPGEISVKEIVNWPEDFKRFKLLLAFWYATNRIPMPSQPVKETVPF